jgi:nitroimidazol reductase NimA-like FMN-containing flavoprotein (pyridoxamine 5'-phosphate oxidase superfamily)
MTTLRSAPADAELEELSEQACRLLLDAVAVGRIAFVVDGRPVILPVNYRVLNDDSGLSILLRARRDHTIDGAARYVAFQIDGIDHGHQQGWSVLVRGEMRHLDEAEIETLSERFDPKPWPSQERTSWLAIRAETVTGRKLLAVETEWAFPSEAYL